MKIICQINKCLTHFYGVTVMCTVIVMSIWKYRYLCLGISIAIRIGISIGIANKLFLPSEIVLKKQNIYVFPCASLGHQYYFLEIIISLRFPIHPSKDLRRSSRKKLFKFSEAFVHCCCEKKNCSESFCIHSSKMQKVGSFLSAFSGLSGTFPRSSLEQLFCRESVRACFCKKELHSTHWLEAVIEGLQLL